MFEAHILYFCYNNTEGDEFAVGCIGNKENWVERINRWNRNDEIDVEYTPEQWDELDQQTDFRGCELAEVEPDERGGYFVTWLDGANECIVLIPKTGAPVWQDNPSNISTIPRWVSRLKKVL